MGKSITFFSSAFLAIGGFLFGYDSGIITSTIAQPQFIDYFNNPSDSVTGGIVSCFQGGAMLGTVINMLFADKMGRKKTIALGSVVSVIGCSLQAGAAAMAMLMVGRFVSGAAVGILTSTIPMYAAELSEPRYRGMQSGLLQWFLSWGFVVAQWLGYGMTFTDTSVQWRFPLAFQCLPALIMVCGIWFLQESPRWLVEQDRVEEAYRVLQKLRSGAPQEQVDLELAEIRDVLAADRINNKTSWTVLFTRRSWLKRLALGCGIQALGPLSGIASKTISGIHIERSANVPSIQNVINYYGPRIYDILGIDTRTSLFIIGISGALSVIYCTIGLLVVDRIGRVKPLIFSAAGMAAALVANAAMSQHLNENNANQLRAMVAMNFCFSLFYTPLGIISWVYPAEIFPVQIRALGNAITTFTNWTINLILSQFSPDALSAIGFRFFYLFFAFNFVALLCYIFFYPETKGKTLEQIDELFGDQLVPHALEDPEAAALAEKQMEVQMIEKNERDV